MKEISKDEYTRIDSALRKAQTKLLEYHLNRGRVWVDRLAYFYSSHEVPCCYGNRESLRCITTGTQRRRRPLPKRFRHHEPWGISTYHFSPKGCPHLNMQTKVLCLARTGHGADDYQYFISKHLVGQCPFKKTYDETK